MAEFDSKNFRKALGQYATGVTIATTLDQDGSKVGMTVTSFNSLSLNPPLILWSIDKKTGCLEAFLNNKFFAIHVLSENQEDISTRFAGRGFDKFEGLPFTKGLGGIPILTEHCVCFQCEMENQYDGGDHIIFIGRVSKLDFQDKNPLLFHNGKYKKIV